MNNSIPTAEDALSRSRENKVRITQVKVCDAIHNAIIEGDEITFIDMIPDDIPQKVLDDLVEKGYHVKKWTNKISISWRKL